MHNPPIESGEDGREGASDVRHSSALEPVRDDKLFHEINLLKLEGRYFTFAAGQRGTRAKPASDLVQPLPDLKELKKQLQAGDKAQSGVFIVTPHPDRGQPGELAYKVLQAILKRVSELRLTALDSVSFSFRELAHLCGRSAFGGKDVKELARAIDQLLTTMVTVGFYNKPTKKWGVHQFSVVNSVAYRGDDKNHPTDPEGAVMLHPLFIKSLQDGHFLCLNFTRFGGLTEAITQALYKRLYFHFSNIHSHRGTFPFKKSYEDICTEWLSGLVIRKHRSKIAEQLARHLDQLKGIGLLASYDIVKAKERDGFNIECMPGPAFFDDYQRFYTAELPSRPLRVLPTIPTIPSPSTLPEAELAAYFYEKKYGTPAAGTIATLSPGDMEFAQALLKKHSPAECRSFVDFALSEARTTNFDVRTFRGLTQYHPAFLARCEDRVRKHAADEARRRQAEDEQRDADLMQQYEAFKRDQVDVLRSQLASSTIADLEAKVRHQMSQAPMRFKTGEERLLRIMVNDILATEHGIPSFDEWKRRRRENLI